MGATVGAASANVFLSPTVSTAATPKKQPPALFSASACALEGSPACHPQATSPHTLTPLPRTPPPPFTTHSPSPPLLNSLLFRQFIPSVQTTQHSHIPPPCKLLQVYPKAFEPWQWTFWSSLQGATIHANSASLRSPSRQPVSQLSFLSFDTQSSFLPLLQCPHTFATVFVGRGPISESLSLSMTSKMLRQTGSSARPPHRSSLAR